MPNVDRLRIGRVMYADDAILMFTYVRTVGVGYRDVLDSCGFVGRQLEFEIVIKVKKEDLPVSTWC
jgi:hypothetical protein